MPNQPATEGSLNESGSKSKSNVRLFVFVVIAVHAIFFAGVLLQACKPKEEPKTAQFTPTPPPPLDTPPPAYPGNLPPGGPPPINPPTVGNPPGGPLPPLPVAPVLPEPPVAPAPVVPAPVAPVPTAVDPHAGPKQHVIAKGDSFATLAKKHGVTTAAIAKANPDASPTKLKIGQKITIPAPTEKGAPPAPTAPGAKKETAGEYTVKSGDSLGKIAKANKTTVKALRDANHLKTDQIKVGQKLKLPGATGAPDKSEK